MSTDTKRRALLGAAPAAGALALLAACSRSGPDQGKAGHLGPRRTVAWAVGTTGSDFVLEISLGCADAAEMLGWRFQRILNTQATPDAHINAIRQAVIGRADVIVTVDWYQAVVDEIAAGEKQGLHFALVNSANNPDTLAPLGVPFVGQQPRDTGRLMGARIAEALAKRGVQAGTVLVGNPFPGSLNVEERIRGIADGLGTAGGIRLVSFADGAAQDSVTAVGLYKAKIRAQGDVVAHAVAGGEMSAIPLFKALDELGSGAAGPSIGAGAARPVIGGWVSSLKVLAYVRTRQMDFALDENLYYQGFMAVLLAWSMLERQMPAASMAPGHTWVTLDTVEAVAGSYERRRQAATRYGLA